MTSPERLPQQAGEVGWKQQEPVRSARVSGGCVAGLALKRLRRVGQIN